MKDEQSNGREGIRPLGKWVEEQGVARVTAYRWRKRGWLQTITIAGRPYLTHEAIQTFLRRAKAGEFAAVPDESSAGGGRDDC